MKKKLNVMRWLLPVAAVSLLAWSCTREIPGQAGDDKGTGNDVIATFADAGTRTSLGEDGNVLWSAGDEISVWLKTADNREYKLDGEGGTTSGTFKYTSGTTDGAAVTYNYGVSPYSEENKLTEDGKLQVTVPVVQPYKEGGFAEGVNVAVAVSEDKNLSFKNLNGYVKVKLYAAEGIKVKDVVLSGTMTQAMVGTATVKVGIGEDPTVEKLEGEGEKEVVVRAEEPIALGAAEAEATEFWFALLPDTFANGITVDVIAEDADGKEFQMTKISSDPLTVVRSRVSEFPAFEVKAEEPAIPDVEKQWMMYYDEYGQVYYDATEGYQYILDIGVTYKDKIAVWKEDENSLSIHNTGPYTISQTPEGYVKVSWEETQYAYAYFLFEEITDTYAFIRLYGEWVSESPYAKQDEEGRYYSLYKMVPMTPQKEFDFQFPMISISGENRYLHGSVQANGYDHNRRFVEDVMKGSSCTLPIVRLNGTGKKEDYKGIDATGKIVVVDRGEINFIEKLQYASEAGAIAVFCANNAPGINYANTDGLPSDVKEIPFLTISQEVGAALNGKETVDLILTTEPPYRRE